jgi:hypothetical protein
LYAEAKEEEEEEKPILFGDIFAADWLFDAWIESDAELVGPMTAKGNYPAFAAHVREPQHDWLIAHGMKPKAIMLVNDDCYLETITKRHERGRLLCAPIFAFDDDPLEAESQRATTSYGRLPLAKGALFDGGMVELRFAFGVGIKTARDVARLLEARVAALNPSGRTALESRWGAHAARRGPDVAQQTANKLAALLSAQTGGVDAARALAKLLAATWTIEGTISDAVDTASEAKAKGETPDVAGLIAEIRRLADTLELHLDPARSALAGLTV